MFLIQEATEALVSQGGEVLPIEGPRSGGVWVEIDACGSVLTLHSPDLGGSVLRWSYEDHAGEFRSVNEVIDWVAFCANGMVADWKGGAA